MAQGRLQDALADLRIAVRLARGWRWNVPPDDASRMGTESWLELVHSALVEAGNRLYLQTHDPALIRETFEAAEENRASSLRAVALAGMPARHFRIAARLLGSACPTAARRGAGAARRRCAETQESVADVRAELVRMELALGPAGAPPAQRALWTAPAARWMTTPRCSVFNWATASPGSGRWTATGSHSTRCLRASQVEVEARAAAAPSTDTAPMARRAVAALANPVWYSGTALSRQGTLADRARPRLHPDRIPRAASLPADLPFEAPLAALPDPNHPALSRRAPCHRDDSRRRLLGGGRAAASAPGSTRPSSSALGDAIYNTADTRLPPFAARRRFKLALMLPRLVGSGRGIDACSRSWRGERVLLKGADASRARPGRTAAAQSGGGPPGYARVGVFGTALVWLDRAQPDCRRREASCCRPLKLPAGGPMPGSSC